MTTNKTRRSKKDKQNKKNILEHDTTKKKHRRHRRRSHRNRNRNRNRIDSSWKNHYTYESDTDASISNISNGYKGTGYKGTGNIVNGLRDFLALKNK